MNPLSTDEINDILDRFSDWLTYSNVIAMDLVPVEHEGNDESRDYELIVEELPQEDIEQLAEENARFGIEERIFEIPPRVVLVEVEESEDGSALEIPTRVITTGEIVEDELLAPVDEDFEEAVSKVRPCPGGYLIKTAGLSGRGSLCTTINYRGKYRILSNNHVISKNGSVGKWVFEPTTELTVNRLKKVTGFDRIKYYSSRSEQNPSYNIKDIAWCDSDPATSSQKVRGIGNVVGRRAPRVGETVKVFGGKTASLKTAKIKSITRRYKSKGSLGYSWWKNGVQLNAYITQGGDSGSAYIASSDNKLVAIHRSGGTNGSTGAPL